MTKTVYILLNGNIARYKGGCSCVFDPNNENQMESFVKFDGYETLEKAKAALRSMKKDSGHGWRLFGVSYLDPSKWEIKTITMTKTIEVY